MGVDGASRGRTDGWRGLLARVRRAWFGVGPAATLKAIVWRIGRLDGEVYRDMTARPAGPSPFDAFYGVETDGFLGWRALQSGEASDAYISGYFGTTPSIGRDLIGCVEQPEEYTFVDLGCGKGRVVILASERVFRRIVGVEISGELAAVARANAAAIRARFGERTPIEVVHDDVVRFAWPPGPLVVFLYQPFERPVMRAMLARLAASLAAAPRSVVFIYLHPNLARLVDRMEGFERRDEGLRAPLPAELSHSYGGRGDPDGFVIWGTRAPAPALSKV